MAEAPIADDAEARRLGALLLAGEARVGRLRERLRQYLQDREPITLDGMELGFFPTKGRYDAAAVFRTATDAGTEPWPLLAADSRALAAFLKRQPGAERVLARAWTASPPWFGHRKTKNADRDARGPDRASARSVAAPSNRAVSRPRGRYSVKEVGEASSPSPLARRRRGKPAAVGMPRDNPPLQRSAFSTSHADRRPGVLIVGFCRGELFVADELLIYAETLGAEEAVHAWLAQHGIQMAPKERYEQANRLVTQSEGPAWSSEGEA